MESPLAIHRPCESDLSLWCRADSRDRTKPRRGSVRSRSALVAEVLVLQRLLDLQALYKGNGVLQIVALLAGDAQAVALDRRLHLQLAALQLLHDALGEILADALLDGDELAHGVAGGLFRLAEIAGAGIDLAPRQIGAQQLVHLAQLQVVVGEEGEDGLLALDRAVRALEVVARADLPLHAGDGVVDFVEIGFGDDVEGRHGWLPRWLNANRGLWARFAEPEFYALRPPREIGRASCSDRVGQYVWI